MCWLPWAKLPIALTTQELVDWLRDRAIEFNAPPQFIDAIDGIPTEDLTSELEELRENRDELKKSVEDIRKIALAAPEGCCGPMNKILDILDETEI